MKTKLIAAALVTAAMAIPAAAQTVDRSDLPTRPESTPGQITISCYRGAVKTIAWDRANAIFIDDLRRLGYTFEQATVIGERVCRDEYGYKNPAYLRETLLRLMRETPPG